MPRPPKQTLATVTLLAGAAGERFGQRVAARHQVDGQWRELSCNAGS